MDSLLWVVVKIMSLARLLFALTAFLGASGVLAFRSMVRPQQLSGVGTSVWVSRSSVLSPNLRETIRPIGEPQWMAASSEPGFNRSESNMFSSLKNSIKTAVGRFGFSRSAAEKGEENEERGDEEGESAAEGKEVVEGDGVEEKKAEEGKEESIDDLLNSEAFLKKKVELLQKQIRKTREEIRQAEADAAKEWEEWGPQIERVEAEYKILQTRMYNTSVEVGNVGKASAVNELLAVADNFERAGAAITPETDGEKAVVTYYKTVYDNMMKGIMDLGVEEVETIGAVFDYEMHNAIMNEPCSEYPENVVCKVFQKGYRIGNQLIRPAMVVVSAG